jgi:hypothetical protein
MRSQDGCRTFRFGALGAYHHKTHTVWRRAVAANRDPGFLNDAESLKVVARQRGTTTSIEFHGEWDLAGLPSIDRAAIIPGPEPVQRIVGITGLLARVPFIDTRRLGRPLQAPSAAPSSSWPPPGPESDPVPSVQRRGRPSAGTRA